MENDREHLPQEQDLEFWFRLASMQGATDELTTAIYRLTATFHPIDHYAVTSAHVDVEGSVGGGGGPSIEEEFQREFSGDLLHQKVHALEIVLDRAAGYNLNLKPPFSLLHSGARSPKDMPDCQALAWVARALQVPADAVKASLGFVFNSMSKLSEMPWAFVTLGVLLGSADELYNQLKDRPEVKTPLPDGFLTRDHLTLISHSLRVVGVMYCVAGGKSLKLCDCFQDLSEALGGKIGEVVD
jgi:hypothetical protein